MLFTGLWWDHLIKPDINLAMCMVLSQSLEFNYGNFKTGSLETTRGLKPCSCPTGISKSYAIGCHCWHQLSACATAWDVWAHVPVLHQMDQMAAPWKWLSWGIPTLSMVFHMACVRRELNNTLKICTAIRTKLLFLSIFPGDLHGCITHCSSKRAHVHRPKQMKSITIRNICTNVLFFQADSHSQLFSFLPPTAVLERGYSAPSVRHPEPKS